MHKYNIFMLVTVVILLVVIFYLLLVILLVFTCNFDVFLRHALLKWLYISATLQSQ